MGCSFFRDAAQNSYSTVTTVHILYFVRTILAFTLCIFYDTREVEIPVLKADVMFTCQDTVCLYSFRLDFVWNEAFEEMPLRTLQ